MTEPEAELQATANLSPVSPSPVHSATSLAVPVLQERVDTIDAMVAAASAAADAAAAADANANTNANVSINRTPNLEPILGAGDDDIVDDDSFNDPYGEDDTDAVAQQVPQPQIEQDLPDSNDDYAKMFDSPIGPEEGEDGDVQPQDVSSVPRESNDISLLSDRLTSHTSQVSHAVHEPSLPAEQGQPVASTASNASSETRGVSVATATPSHSSNQPASSPTATKLDASNNVGSDSASTDINRLVTDLTAPANSNSNSSTALSASFATGEQSHDSGTTSSAFTSSASLPPRPPLSQTVPQTHASQHHPGGVNASISPSLAAPPTPGQPSTYVAAGAPVSIPDSLGEFSIPLGSGLQAPVAITSINAPPYPPQHAPYNADQAQDAEYQRQWDQFLADERQYMSEAKWDRFPEGSRIFIGTRSASGASKNGAHIFSTGNLSSDKVSKRDVFDLFHRFGRLAQISLKSAYGFVQYHNIDEGHRAIENLQGIEIKGRRIHLEVSRVQDKSKKERVRSPDRNKARDSGRRNDKHGAQNRDDYRSSRGHSPRNDYGRDESYGRDRGYHDGGRGRGRSRSPSHGRNDKDNYRRRSPSPYGRPHHEVELDLPRRYGADVPDVQVILQPDVNREFVIWVEQAFKSKGLRCAVMYLRSNFPKNAVIQRQAAEGVHAVVDLDLRAQTLGKIPVQAFDRSAGSNNVRYDQYVDLDPSTAADVILRAKASGASPSYGQSYSGNGYGGVPFGGQPPYQAPTASYPAHPPPAQYGQQQPHSANIADITNLLGQLDPASLQQFLAQLQGSAQNPALAQAGAATAGASQADIQALLGSLGGAPAAQQSQQQHHPAPGAYGASYGAQPPSNGAPPNGDAAVQVQNIMAQLARYR